MNVGAYRFGYPRPTLDYSPGDGRAPVVQPGGWPMSAKLRPGLDGGLVLPSHWYDGRRCLSYATCILDRADNGDLLFNATHYSVTTAKYAPDALHAARAERDVSGTRVRYLYGVPRGTRDLRVWFNRRNESRNRLGVETDGVE